MNNNGESVTAPGRIRTYSGRWFDYSSPTPGMVHLEDIAHALACTSRYAGHVPKPYSVAQHLVLCSQVAPDGLELDALMHDAHEAYIGDMPRPLKVLMPEYVAMEERIEAVVRRAFRLPDHMDPRVKEVDVRMLVTEAKSFGFDWWREVGMDPYPGIVVEPWPWHKAKQRFLNAAHRLGL